jgi:hypothetical protein
MYSKAARTDFVWCFYLCRGIFGKPAAEESKLWNVHSFT